MRARVRRATSTSARACSPRGLVLAPAQDLRPVADATAAGVVERDLDDQLGAERDPLEVLLALPAAGIAVAPLAGLVRRELAHERPLLGGLQPRGVPDPAQLAGVVVEPEDQRADRARLLAGAVPDDDGIDRPHPLDLHHPGALAGAVGRPDVLGHDALATAQPRLGFLGRGRQRRQPRVRRERAPRARRAARRRASRATTRPRARAGRTRRTAPAFPRASMSIRDFAGWIRCWSASKSWPPSGSSITISPSTT